MGTIIEIITEVFVYSWKHLFKAIARVYKVNPVGAFLGSFKVIAAGLFITVLLVILTPIGLVLGIFFNQEFKDGKQQILKQYYDAVNS